MTINEIAEHVAAYLQHVLKEYTISNDVEWKPVDVLQDGRPSGERTERTPLFTSVSQTGRMTLKAHRGLRLRCKSDFRFMAVT